MDDSQLDLSLPHIDYSNSLYIGIRISQSAPSHLQLVQNEAVPGKDTISPLFGISSLAISEVQD